MPAFEGPGAGRPDGQVAPRRLLSRRAVLGGSVAVAASLLGLGKASALMATESVPWAKRIWGYLTAGDGVRLRYTVLFPPGDGPFAVALQYSGYDSGTIGGTSYQQGNTWLSEDVDTSLLDAGYALMGLSMRGTGCSSGTFDLFGSQWGTDGALAVEWAAAQPWSTGRVAMYDWSWAGICQLFVAAERPRGLAAVAPGMVVTDPLRDVGAPGGVPNVLFPALWWATILDSWTYEAQNAEGDSDQEGLVNLATNLAVAQASSPVTASAHPYEDSYWAARDLRARTARIDVPVLSMEDWQDEEVGPRGGYYQELLDPATTWYVGTNGQHDIYVNNRFRQQLVAFFDHFAKGVDNGFASTPRVQLWLDTTAPGAPEASDSQLEVAEPGHLIQLAALPVPVDATVFYLSPDGYLATDADPTESEIAYVAAPGPTVNDGLVGAITGGPGGPVGEQTWTSLQPPAGSYAAFTTLPFRGPVTFSGSASLDLWISSLAPDTDLQATVTEIRPDGQEQYIQRGWLRVSQRALDPELSNDLRPVHLQTLASTQLLSPGEPVEARLEINKFTHTFRVGSSLRIIIDAPSNTGDWAFASYSGAVNTIHMGGQRASRLAVGMLDVTFDPGGYPSPKSLVGSPCRTDFISRPQAP